MHASMQDVINGDTSKCQVAFRESIQVCRVLKAVGSHLFHGKYDCFVSVRQRSQMNVHSCHLPPHQPSPPLVSELSEAAVSATLSSSLLTRVSLFATDEVSHTDNLHRM